MNKPPPGSFYMRFWGARGSFPVPGPDTLRYGGNTSCIEIGADGHTLIIDCGSGAHALGNALVARGCKTADVYFTHTHFDHICGLPFFVPVYQPEFAVRFFAGHLGTDISLSETFDEFMEPKFCPVQTHLFKNCSMETFAPPHRVSYGNGLILETLPLNHPGGSIGYKISFGGRSIAIITDHEHGDEDIDGAIVDFVKDCEAMVYDAMFTDAEYPHFVGWGHSTWQQAIDIAKKANVPHPLLFHHAPQRDDDSLDRIRAAAQEQIPGAEAAAEGMIINVTQKSETDVQ